jgi:glycerophosphoryl diester phosphodiesterase
VRLTADDVLVVCHDDRLNRTTGARGRVSKQPFCALRELDAGSWFGAGFACEPIPTLDEVLVLCHEIGLGANVEIKAESGRVPRTVTALAACFDRLADTLPPILISSFLVDAVSGAARLVPAIPRGLLWRKVPRDWRDVAERLDCETIHCGHADLTAAVAAEISHAGYKLLAYTVNDPARARQLFDWGVASVFSDAPDMISGSARLDSCRRA